MNREAGDGLQDSAQGVAAPTMQLSHAQAKKLLTACRPHAALALARLLILGPKRAEATVAGADKRWEPRGVRCSRATRHTVRRHRGDRIRACSLAPATRLRRGPGLMQRARAMAGGCGDGHAY